MYTIFGSLVGNTCLYMNALVNNYIHYSHGIVIMCKHNMCFLMYRYLNVNMHICHYIMLKRNIRHYGSNASLLWHITMAVIDGIFYSIIFHSRLICLCQKMTAGRMMQSYSHIPRIRYLCVLNSLIQDWWHDCIRHESWWWDLCHSFRICFYISGFIWR